MSCEDYLKFKGVQHIGEAQVISHLENNLKMWLDWCFLKIGGWTDVDISTSGPYGGDYSTLELVADPSYINGQVWQTARKDWVWETGVNYENNSVTYNPIPITGIEVDGTTYETGDVTYEHYYNYPLGRVVFSSPIDTDSVVRLAYSFRDVQVYIANQGEWAAMQEDSMRVDDSHFGQSTKGEWSIGGQHRIQMPAILIETAANRGRSPWEIGSGSFEVNQPILFHIFTQDKFWRDTLTDILDTQSGKSIYLYNVNSININNDFPLNYNGMLTGNKNYPDFVDTDANGGYRWKICKFSNGSISQINTHNSNLYHSVVRLVCNFKFP
jgi:hypothetical protein